MTEQFDEAQAQEQMELIYQVIMAREGKTHTTVEKEYGPLLKEAYQRAEQENRPLNGVLRSLSSNATQTRRIGAELVDTWTVLGSDLLFVAVPFIVIFAVFFYLDKLDHFLGISEWAFAAAILAGQTITKFTSGILKSELPIREPRVTFLITLVLVLGVVPSLLVLVLNLLETEAPSATDMLLSRGLTIAQLIVFVLAVSIYVVLGGAGQLLMARKESG